MTPCFIKMLAAAGLAVAVSYAGPINFGFEMGSFYGWTIDRPNNVYFHSVTTDFLDHTAKSGNYFAVLTAGLGLDDPTRAYQTFNLNAGDTLSGWAGFKANDWIFFDDKAQVSISTGGDNVVPWLKDIYYGVGSFGDSGWQHWSYTAPTTGTYTIAYEVVNEGNQDDNLYDSQAYFDGTFIARIPDFTSTVALVGLGLAALIGFRRRWT